MLAVSHGELRLRYGHTVVPGLLVSRNGAPCNQFPVNRNSQYAAWFTRCISLHKNICNAPITKKRPKAHKDIS
jgi:hypothetical protein